MRSCAMLLVALFLPLIIIVPVATKKKHRLKTDSDTNEDLSPEEYNNKHDEDHIQLNEKGQVVLNLKGQLRKKFALEAVLKYPLKDSVCSPLSALLPLGKLALGAKGKSQKQLHKAIGVKNKSSIGNVLKPLIVELERLPGVSLTIASKIYLGDRDDISTEFRDDAKKIFKSVVDKINFGNQRESADTINEWVSQETRGMIPYIIYESDINADTSAIIVNAVYFSGTWKTPFDYVYTTSFYTPHGEIEVSMMKRKKSFFHYSNSSTLDAQILELPYNGEGASFIIVLPHARDGLDIVLQKLKLNPELLERELKLMSKIKIEVNIPKFTVQSEWDLESIYEKVGAKNIFNSRNTGLTGILSDGREVRVSRVKQSAVLELHELGTEGAAATAVVIELLALQYELKFVADHPFLFYVIVKKEQLFAGLYYGQ